MYEPFREIRMTEILELSKAVLSIQQELLAKQKKESTVVDVEKSY